MALRRLILVGLLAAFTVSAEGRRIRLGGVQVGAGYSGGSGYWGPGMWGPGMWGPGMWGWGPMWRSAWMWDPFWYSGWAHPGFFGGFAQGPGMGEIKLNAPNRDAMVCLNGAYAGSAGKLKNIWLQPGVYNLEVKDESGGSWTKKVYVLSGKTLNLRASL